MIIDNKMETPLTPGKGGMGLPAKSATENLLGGFTLVLVACSN
jgi:hypothetical protein